MRRHLGVQSGAAQAIGACREAARAHSRVVRLNDVNLNLLVADVPSWLIAGFAFVFGAAWGSFFNVAIYRWPLGLSVVRPASHCPYCRARVPARHNIPIIGYLLLRGKTACCGNPLSPRYPIVEALTALLCVAVAERFVISADRNAPLVPACLIALCYFAFVGGLLVATFVDLEHMEIPDEVSLPGAALGLVTAVYRDPPGVESAALGAGGGFLLIQVLFVWTYEALLGRRGMGEGDSKLLLMIGAFIGWQGAAFALFAGAAQGLLVAVYALITGRSFAPKDRGDAEEEGELDDTAAAHPIEHAHEDDPPPAWIGHLKLPFGPFLALGALEYLFFGDTLVDAWLNLAGRAMSVLHLG
jgi:leader peptidase (prepilin peptidase)/N-methyltransferase